MNRGKCFNVIFLYLLYKLHASNLVRKIILWEKVHTLGWKLLEHFATRQHGKGYLSIMKSSLKLQFEQWICFLSLLSKVMTMGSLNSNTWFPKLFSIRIVYLCSHFTLRLLCYSSCYLAIHSPLLSLVTFRSHTWLPNHTAYSSRYL